MSPRRDRGGRGDVPLPALWFALLGGPAAWSAHLLASYPLVPVACRMGTTAPLNILTAVTAAIAVAAAGTGWWGYRRSRSTGDDGAPGHSAGPGRTGGTESRAGFMAFAGLLLAILFTFAIVLEGLPPVLQDPCTEGL